MRAAALPLALLAAHLTGADPGPSQPAGAVNPSYRGATLNAPFPDNVYGADHGGSTLTIAYPFTGGYGATDHAHGVITYACAPFSPRGSEGVYGIDVWLEAQAADGSWSPVALHGGVADAAGSPYQAVNTPNPGPSAAFTFRWTYDSTALPAFTAFRVFAYTYLYNQGGGAQGNFYVASTLAGVTTGAADDPPAIAWDPPFGATNPAQVAGGQPYTIAATGTDDNGNLASVTLWKNGLPFAAAGGGAGAAADASGQSSDPGGAPLYTAQATDSAGLTSPVISLTVAVVGKSAQPPVSSADAQLIAGQPFTPATTGGAGTGGWQFCVGGYTNFNGGTTPDTGTQLPSGAWTAAWTAPSPGTYSFWVSRNGDATYLPSAVAGPYTLSVLSSFVAPVPPPPLLPDPTAPSSSAPSSSPLAPSSAPAAPSAAPSSAPSAAPSSAPSAASAASASGGGGLPQFTLTTSVSGNGSVTPGGTFPENTLMTVTATPGGGARFTDWNGTYTTTTNPVVFFLESNVTLIAQFAPNGPWSQYIFFPTPPISYYPGPPVALQASASSNLPVSYQLTMGTGTILGNLLTAEDYGLFVIEALQPGNAQYQAAPPVYQTTFIEPNPHPPPVIARLRYNAAGRHARIGLGAGSPTSPLWTDPSNLGASPWPAFNILGPAAPGPANVLLPATPAAGLQLH